MNNRDDIFVIDSDSTGELNLDRIEVEFSDILDLILSDVSNIDVRLQDIQRYITMIDQSIMTLEQRIQSEPDIGKKIKYQGVMMKLLETMSQYQDTYHKFLQIKHSYRKSHSTAIRDKIRLKIDYSKNTKENADDMSISKLIKTFSALSSNPDKQIPTIEDDDFEDLYNLK